MFVIKKILIAILTLEARLIIKKYRPFVIAVTGSVGKTSTKDAIYTVLKKQSGSYIRSSEKSLNSEIGLPLTIIGVSNAWYSISGWWHNVTRGLSLILEKHDYPDTLIVEVGADHPGDIRRVAKWLQPNIAVITRISKTPVHVEYFSSPEEVFEEKVSLAKSIKKGGALILYGDDDNVESIKEGVRERGAEVITFGTSSGSVVRGSGEHTIYDDSKSPEGISFTVEIDGKGSAVTLKGIIGSTYMYPLLAAAAVGKALGLSSESIASGLNEYQAPKGRMNLIAGINNSTLIDDSYNSSPDAAKAALEVLKNLKSTGQKIAVLGDMMELGKYSADEHRKIGTLASTTVSQLVTVGVRSRATADEAISSGMSTESVHPFVSGEDAISYLKSAIEPGDIILIKGSQSVRAERIVKALMNEPEKASELLVRQEKEWLEKK
jgi:UDP-N-acetylmuramyl pentapeptide synthase